MVPKWLDTNNLTLYAVWQLKQYTVTYNANGGTGSNVSQTVKYNTDWTTKPITMCAKDKPFGIPF